MFRNKEAIVCDMDGTLIDSIGLWNDVDTELISSFGKIPHQNVGIERTKFLSENTGGDIYADYCKFLIDTYGIEGISPQDLSTLRSEFSKDFHEHHMDFKPGADEFLLRAKEKGYKLFLASSTSKWVIDIYNNKNKKMMSKLLMRDVFDGILTREDVSHKKPNPEVYLRTIELSGKEKHRVIAIEDELVGVKAAISAGIDVISMYDKYADTDRDYIDALATYSVKDYYPLIKRL